MVNIECRLVKCKAKQRPVT